MKRLLLGLFLISAGTPALAGDAGAGLPLNIIVSEGGAVLFNVVENRTSAPACATDPNRFSMPTNTDYGKAMISALLIAQARGKKVFVHGTGNCNVFTSTESVGYIVVED